MASNAPTVSLARLEGLIYFVRSQKAMLDRDLAALYGVETKVLNQAVRRNAERFPADFSFVLNTEEASALARLRSQTVTLKRGQHRKYLPRVFTEQGVAMLSSVVNSPRAIRVNIEIMRAFVRLRQMLASNADLARRLDELEAQYDEQFKIVFAAIRRLMSADESKRKEPRREIGYHTLRDDGDAPPPPPRRKPRKPVRY
jgi:hypothetical protein